MHEDSNYRGRRGESDVAVSCQVTHQLRQGEWVEKDKPVKSISESWAGSAYVRLIQFLASNKTQWLSESFSEL